MIINIPKVQRKTMGNLLYQHISWKVTVNNHWMFINIAWLDKTFHANWKACHFTVNFLKDRYSTVCIMCKTHKNINGKKFYALTWTCTLEILFIILSNVLEANRRHNMPNLCLLLIMNQNIYSAIYCMIICHSAI